MDYGPHSIFSTCETETTRGRRPSSPRRPAHADADVSAFDLQFSSEQLQFHSPATFKGSFTLDLGAVNLAKDYPLNFDFRSILEKKACAIQHMSLGSPKRDLEKERLEINPSWLRNKAVACFSQNCRKIFCACIAVEKICSENTW
uniref:Uncharacterized protein n=1 Tax=Steinernema glaseri TaxID=37863 RepID=A0A1I7ZZJ3_9BILA